MARKVKKRPMPKRPKTVPVESADKAIAVEKNSPKTEDRGEEIMSWSVTPVFKDRRKGFILVACILSFTGLVYFGYRDWFWPVVALVLSTASFSSFLLPNTYSLTTKGVVFRNGVTTLFRPWAGFTRYRAAPDGIYLVFKKTVRTRLLGPGIFLYFGDDNKEQVMSILESNWQTS